MPTRRTQAPDTIATDAIERQERHFSKIADRYQAARQGRTHLLLKHLMWSAFFRRARPLLRGPLDVLDAMCGSCDAWDILRRHLGRHAIRTYRGFDYSRRVVETVRATRPELTIERQDATSYQPRPSSCDLVVLLGGLHHVPDHAARVVGAMSRALRPGGWFINLEPTHANALTRAIRDRIYRRNSLFDEQTERAFGVRELFGFFEDTGLHRRIVMHPGLLAYVLYYNPDAFPMLNHGGPAGVHLAWALDRPLIGTRLGRLLSFCTLSMWQRPA